MDNLGTEVVRFFNQYQAALAALGGIQETLKTDDAHTLKATLIESGILERGVERERRLMMQQLREQQQSQQVDDDDDEDDDNGLVSSPSAGGGTTTRPATKRVVVIGAGSVQAVGSRSTTKASSQSPLKGSSKNSQPTRTPHPTMSRLQAAVDLLLSTNHHSNSNSNNGAMTTTTAASASMTTSSNGTNNTLNNLLPTTIPMMPVEQRSVVQLKLQLLFEDLNGAVERLQHVMNGEGGNGGGGFNLTNSSGGGYGNVGGGGASSDDEDDDYQILRHHIFADGSSTSSPSPSRNTATCHRKMSPVSHKGATAAIQAAAGTTASTAHSSNTTKTSKGAFRTLKSKAMLPSHVEDLRLLCEDLHEKEFLAQQKLRMSEVQKEELLFRLNAREETLRGLRTHFLKELVDTVGSLNTGGGSGGGGTNTSAANNNANTSSNHALAATASRFAGIPITFIEERDIEVARRVANAQLELEKIRSDHGKELWRQRESWAKRLEAKEKELIQMQIMFRNALASLQGKHASAVSKIVDENSTLKQTNVQVESMALQRAEAFFEMRLNEKIAQLTTQYEGKLSLMADKLSAANEAFRQSLLELKAERREKRRLQTNLQEAERSLDHALLVEIPNEADRASRGMMASFSLLQKANEQLIGQLASLEKSREDDRITYEEQLKQLANTNERLSGELKAAEGRLKDSQNEVAHIKLQMKGAVRAIEESKEAQIRVLKNELAILRDRLKRAGMGEDGMVSGSSALATTTNNNNELDENFKFGRSSSSGAGAVGGDVNTSADDNNHHQFLEAQIAQLRDERDELTALLEALKLQLAEKEKLIEGVQKGSGGGGADTSNNSNTKTSTADAATIEKQKRHIAKLESELTRLKDAMKDLQTRYDATHDKCYEYRLIIEQLEELLSEREQQLAALGVKIPAEGEEGHRKPSTPSGGGIVGSRVESRLSHIGAGGTPPPPSLVSSNKAGGGESELTSGRGSPIPNLRSNSALGNNNNPIASRAGSYRQLLSQNGYGSYRVPPPMVSVACDTTTLVADTLGVGGGVGWLSLADSSLYDGPTAGGFLNHSTQYSRDGTSSVSGTGGGGASIGVGGSRPMLPTPTPTEVLDGIDTDIYLVKERQLNANLRRKLADLNAQIRIASKEQEWPFMKKLNDHKHNEGGESGNDDSSATNTPTSATKKKAGVTGTSASSRRGSVTTSPAADGVSVLSPTAAVGTPSVTVLQPPVGTTASVRGGSRPPSAANARRPSSSSAGAAAGAASSQLPEMAPIPITRPEDINAQNKSFQTEIDRRVSLLSDLMDKLRAEEAEEQLQLLLLLQQQQQNAGHDGSVVTRTADGRLVLSSSNKPPRSRPQSAHVANNNTNGFGRTYSNSGRYNMASMPLPPSRMSVHSAASGADYDQPVMHFGNEGFNNANSGAAGGRFGSGFVVSHRPTSATTLGERNTKKGRAPTLEYNEMGVYDDDEDEEHLAMTAQMRRDNNQHNPPPRPPSVVEAHYLQNEDEGDNPNNVSYSKLYDKDGNPRYVKGFVDKRYRRGGEDDNNDVNYTRSTGGPTRGQMAPRAHMHAPFNNTNGGTMMGQQHHFEYDPTQHEATSRYIQPQSFFTVRNRLNGGGGNTDDDATGGGGGSSNTYGFVLPPPQQGYKWEMSGPQIRRAASRGLVKGSTATTTSPRSVAAGRPGSSPRYRPLPAEEGGDGHATTTHPDDVVVSRGTTANSGAAASSRGRGGAFIPTRPNTAGLSRPITAGPVRPPATLEVSRTATPLRSAR